MMVNLSLFTEQQMLIRKDTQIMSWYQYENLSFAVNLENNTETQKNNL